MKSAMDLALNILSRRTVTRYELEKYLRDKNVVSEKITETISRLIDWGYLNDGRLAAEYCQLHSGRHSRLRIRKDLLLRGLDKILVEEVLSTSYPQDQELQLCMDLARRILERESYRLAKQKMREKVNNKIPRKILLHNKVSVKLARLGYPYEMINKVLSSLANGEIVT
ncbi:MAG TPA: regulatory protein RecX [Desulfitobacteriaceae bacterium]|nr:regulatory protein RecX [Desulfitobacteriaceae bacterium]